MNENSKTNLLIDSLSDDSEDVPDLQLIPVVKTKKKKLRKVTGPKWPNRSKLEEETTDTFGSNEGRRSSRLWSCSLTFTLLSLVIGLIICSSFCMRLYKEVESLKEILNASSIEYKERLKTIEDKLTFVLSIPDRTHSNFVHGGAFSNITSPLPLINTMQNDKNFETLQHDYKNVLAELNSVKEQIQNVTHLEDVDKDHYSNLEDNKIIQDLQNNVNIMLANCTKVCSPSLMTVNVPQSPGPPGSSTDIPGSETTPLLSSGRP